MSEEKYENAVTDVDTNTDSLNETEESVIRENNEISENSEITEINVSSSNSKNDKKSVVDEKTKRFLKENARLDRFYDGYYDDVIPEDEGEITNHKIDNETIKKVALVVGGGVILIVLSILMLLRG